MAHRPAPFCVRKHRVPKGALRRARPLLSCLSVSQVRKHRAPKGALRLGIPERRLFRAPLVRKHRAPKGALRQFHRLVGSVFWRPVRKRQAPSTKHQAPSTKHQAPSTKRYIKPSRLLVNLGGYGRVRKHRAPKGALRRQLDDIAERDATRQETPSAKRYIKTGQKLVPFETS